MFLNDCNELVVNFIGYLNRVPLFEIWGFHKYHCSIVGPNTLKREGIEIPYIPKYSDWKKGRYDDEY